MVWPAIFGTFVKQVRSAQYSIYGGCLYLDRSLVTRVPKGEILWSMP
jgi:hypothetical protein